MSKKNLLVCISLILIIKWIKEKVLLAPDWNGIHCIQQARILGIQIPQQGMLWTLLGMRWTRQGMLGNLIGILEILSTHPMIHFTSLKEDWWRICSHEG